MGGFPSGQRGQTVNLLALPSVVRIHLRPFTYLLRATVLARMRLISAIGMYEKRICRSGGTGRRPGLKIPWEESRAGSTPVSGTISRGRAAW